MKKSLRATLLGLSVFGMVSCIGPQPAEAYFQHHHKHTAHHTKPHHKKIDTRLLDAQTSLINLRYLSGKPDGILGPKTVRAIKNFQKDHELRATGKLTKETYNAIIKADSARAMASLPMPTPKKMPLLAMSELQHGALPAQAGLVGPTDQQYADPLVEGLTVIGDNGAAQAVRTQSLSSRYAKLDINENINGSQRRYNLTMNGTPLLQTDNQPSIIGISPTYTLEQEDLIILTTYRNDDPVCAYKHYLLSLAQGRNELHLIGNCTHGYQARKVEDSLFITFPEFDDQRMAGATWRYESGQLERL